MKKILVFSAVLVIICSSFTVLADPTKDIIGKWKIDQASIGGVAKSIINATKKSNPDKAQQLEEHIEMLNQILESMEFEYKADNTYEIQTPQGPQQGRWLFSADGTQLTVTRDGKPDRKDIVLEISPNRLKLINTERGDTTLFIRY